MSNSARPHRWQPTRLPRPWDSPGKNTGVGCHFLLQRMKVKSESEVAQQWPTLSDLMDCSLPGSSVLGIFQARVLEWGAIAFSAIHATIIIYSNSLCISNPVDITIIVYKVHIHLDLSTYLASWFIFSSSCILLILDCGKKDLFALM